MLVVLLRVCQRTLKAPSRSSKVVKIRLHGFDSFLLASSLSLLCDAPVPLC